MHGGAGERGGGEQVRGALNLTSGWGYFKISGPKCGISTSYSHCLLASITKSYTASTFAAANARVQSHKGLARRRICCVCSSETTNSVASKLSSHRTMGTCKLW